MVDLFITRDNMDIFDLLVPRTKRVITNAQKNSSRGAYTPQEIGASALGPLGLLLAGSQRQQEVGKAGLELGSFAIPMGKTGNLLTRFGLPGAVSGAVRGASADNPTAQSLATSAIGGGVGSTLTGGLFDVLGKIGSKATNEVPEQLMNQVFKEPLKATKSAVAGGETLGKMALKRGTKGVSDEAILQGAQGKMDALEESLNTALQSSNQTVGIDDITNTVKPLLEKWGRAGNTADVNAITSRIEALRIANGDKIPVAAANEIKRTIYAELGNKYGAQSSEGVEGLKAIARGLKESIASKVRGVDKINEELGFNGRVRDAMISKIASSTRSSGLGLRDTVLAAGGVAGAAGSGGLSLLPFLGSLAGNTGTKTTMANALNQTGKSIGKSSVPGVLGQLLGMGGAQSGIGINQLMSGPKSPNGNNNNSSDSNQPHNNDIIPQTDQKPLKDGDLDPSGQWKFDAKKGDFVPNTQTQEGSLESGSITKEKIGQVMLADLLKTGGKNIDKLAKISEFVIPEEGKKKTPSAASLQVKGKATAALSALDNIESLLKEDPNVLLKASIPGAPGARQYESAISSITDAVGGLRTGATVSKEQQAFYRNLLPKVGDSEDTVKKKLKALRDELGVYLEGSSQIEDPLQSLLTPQK